MSIHHTFCAVDFGTSNSAVAVPATDGMRLVELEPGQHTMPTAVFYFAEGPHDADGPPRAFGRAAVAAYVEGHEGRLMRSMKSILGSALIDQTTDVGGGSGAKYADIVAGYLKRLRRLAGDPQRVVLGRPVFFVDGEPERDALAQAQLEAAARAVGFTDVQFQFEPIAAALDFERQAVSEGRGEQIVLVADIGGGTSDFSIVRVGPERMQRLARRDDILASHGIHIAGTDFDRHIELAGMLEAFGYRSSGPSGRELPSGLYFDLATWHLINSCYTPQRVAEWRGMKSWFSDARQHARLMTVLEERLGHELAARAEGAKIAISGGADTEIDLGLVERGLRLPLTEQRAVQALRADLDRIIATAHETVAQAGLRSEQIDALYFTGGSTGLRLLVDGLAAGFPQAARVSGDRLASVATGLGLYAQRLFGHLEKPRLEGV